MHATIDVRFELRMDEYKTLPLAALAEAITDQDSEARLLDAVVPSLNEQLVEVYYDKTCTV